MSTPSKHLFKNIEDIREFMFAGNARITLKSKNTGARFTYRIRLPKPKPGIQFRRTPYFVQVLTGPDNGEHFQYIGTIFNKAEFFHSSRSRVNRDARSVRVFEWFSKRLASKFIPDALEVWHEGRCGRCGRVLTVPESIERGIGPECVKFHGPQVQRDFIQEGIPYG